jgi:beta-1,4-mannooligosaccharide/beta-1,4-mannosyl-N-acetylglucosamine phosphorylase
MKRAAANPILTRNDIPEINNRTRDVTSVFNPGAVKFRDEFILLLRVQNRARETLLMKAVSQDGLHFEVVPKEVVLLGLDKQPQTFYHIYDPRITCIDAEYHIVTAMDSAKGCYLGWFKTQDFEVLEFQGIVSEANNRNGILFPEKIQGLYTRFDRPNEHVLENGVKTGNAICCSVSKDLLHWQNRGVVLPGRPYYWDELIGSGPPPIKTKHGWLHIYHGVATHFGSSNIYQAGVSLHPLEAPWEVLGRGKYNILEPRELYELTGQVPNVVFPSGAIALSYDDAGVALDDSLLYIYYGAADTCVGCIITTIIELIGECNA